MRRRLLVILILALLPAGGAHPARAQRAHDAAERGGWLPRSIQIDGAGLSESEKRSAIARLEQIERILRRVSELARPLGFEIEPRYFIADRSVRPNEVVAYRLALWFYAPSRTANPAGCSCVDVVVNFPAGALHLFEKPSRHEVAQGQIILYEPARGEPLPGATPVDGQLSPKEQSRVAVVLTPDGRSPWQPVTRAELLNALIVDADLTEVAATWRKSLERTPYQQWLAESARRRQEREATLRELAALRTPAEVAQVRRTMEERERDVGARLKASEDADRAAARELIASASYAAWLRADQPRALRVVPTDPGFWRVRASPVEARAIAVHLAPAGAAQTYAVNHAILQTFRTLDWAGLRRLTGS